VRQPAPASPATTTRLNPIAFLCSLLLLLTPALTFLPSHLSAAEENQEKEGDRIQLFRPMFEGQRFVEFTTANYSENRFIDTLEGEDFTISMRDWTIELEARQEVLATTPGGSPQAYLLVFDKLIEIQRLPEAKTTDLLPPGTVVEAESVDGDSIFKVDGEPLDEELTTTLTDLFGMSDEDTDRKLDDLLETHIPRTTGERWLADPQNAVKWFTIEDRQQLNPAAAAEATYFGRKDVRGEEIFQIGYALSYRHDIDEETARFGDYGLRYMFSSISDLPVDNKSMDLGYRSTRSTRESYPMLNPGRNAEVPPGIIIYERMSDYDTRIEALPPADAEGAEPLVPEPPKANDNDEAAAVEDGTEE